MNFRHVLRITPDALSLTCLWGCYPLFPGSLFWKSSVLQSNLQVHDLAVPCLSLPLMLPIPDFLVSWDWDATGGVGTEEALWYKTLPSGSRSWWIDSSYFLPCLFHWNCPHYSWKNLTDPASRKHSWHKVLLVSLSSFIWVLPSSLPHFKFLP